MLVGFDFADGGEYARVVEAGEQPHEDDARLVAEHGPAEVRRQVEDDGAQDADDGGDDAGARQQTHPRPHSSQVRLVDRVEVLHTLHRHLHRYTHAHS